MLIEMRNRGGLSLYSCKSLVLCTLTAFLALACKRNSTATNSYQ